jgi:hypothetical protein
MMLRSLIALAAPLMLCAGHALAQQTYNIITSNNITVNGHFGAAVAWAPDIDGDGVPDFLVGANDEAVGLNLVAGRVHIYSGATGALVRTINPPLQQNLGTFGWSVAGTPDLNGDGRGDVLAGAIWHRDNEDVICGRAYLFSGATGQVLRAWVPPGTHQDSQAFGFAVAVIPDITGDGIVELAVAAEGEQVGIVNGAGRVHIYNGATGGWVRTLTSPTPQVNAAFGYALSGMPDITGDGRGEIIVGAPFQAPGAAPANCGRVYVYSGANGALLRAIGSVQQSQDGLFGQAVAAVGDINNDGKPDILIGAPGESALGVPGAGRAYVYGSAAWNLVKSMNSPVPTTNSAFGFSVSPMRTAGGALTMAYVVGEPKFVRGKAFVYFPNRGYQTPLAFTGARFGWSVAGMGDLNNDGTLDLVVGAPLDGPGGRGRAYLIK